MAAALPAPAMHPPAVRTGPAGDAGKDAGNVSLMNIAGRQRMLSQRIVLQTVLAVQGQAEQARAARQTLELFETSQARLVQTPRQLDAASAREVQAIYHGPQGVGAAIDAFARQARTVLDLADHGSARAADALGTLVGTTDGVLKALDAATTVFDQVQRRQSEAMMNELTGPRRLARARIRRRGECAFGHHGGDRPAVAAGRLARRARPQGRLKCVEKGRSPAQPCASAASRWICAKRSASSLRRLLRSRAASQRRRSSGVEGESGGTAVGLRSSSTATMVKKQLLTWRTTWVRMSSATTFTPISIDEVPV